MTARVLHVLAQRPGRTGSGITLDALVRRGIARGREQHVVVGVPADGPEPAVAGLARERIHPLCFGTDELPFPVPGMSDVMPYPSSRWAALTDDQLARYRAAWRTHLARVLTLARPDVVHVHHVWMVAALLADLAPQTPVVVHVHATGLRQLELCPHLAHEVRSGCARHAAFCVLHREHTDAVATALGVERARIHVVGAGYREDVFHARGRAAHPGRILYAGKLSAAKGLPELLSAFDSLRAANPELELFAAGSGAGAEARAIAAQLDATPGATALGHVDPPDLAAAMRSAAVFCLPSYYEGLPLVLVEAAACGCRLVATALPGVVDPLAAHLGSALETVPLPRMATIDRPQAGAVPAFVGRLARALRASLDRGPADPQALDALTWDAVAERVEAVWSTVIRR